MGVKKPEKTVKSGREKRFLPVKKTKNIEKMAFTPIFGFHAQKKNTAKNPPSYESKYKHADHFLC